MPAATGASEARPLARVLFRHLPPFLVAVGMVVACTLLSLMLSTWLAPGSLDLLYLTGVLLVAMNQGLWPSLVCSVLSYLAYSYYFVPPVHSLHIDRSQDWLDLLAFMVAAMITGTLTATVRRQLTLIRRTAQQNHQLYDFTAGIASAITRGELAALVRQHVSATLHCEARLLFLTPQGTLDSGGETPNFDEASLAAARESLQTGSMAGRGGSSRADTAWTFLPLGSGGDTTAGVLGVRLLGTDDRLDRNHQRLLRAMRDQTLIALDRIDIAARMEQTQLLKETERLREALLSSVSHDLRTPLSSIIGAATTLRDLGGELHDGQRRELLDTVIDESSRLNRFVQNLLDMTRIGYGALKPRAAWVDLREIAGEALRTLSKAYPEHRVVIEGADDELPAVFTDAVLLERVLFNLLDNAAKYAPASEPITVGFRHDGEALTVTVSDAGPGIPADERERVFDMFHRVQRGDGTPAGTGMGLAICRGLMQALGGNIAAHSGPDGRGTSMILTLTLHPAPP